MPRKIRAQNKCGNYILFLWYYEYDILSLWYRVGQREDGGTPAPDRESLPPVGGSFWFPHQNKARIEPEILICLRHDAVAPMRCGLGLIAAKLALG
jgi:hypothetical protein